MVTVQITCSTPEAQIRYTLDNSEPNEQSNLYSEQIELNLNTTVKAKAFKEGYESSDTSFLNVIVSQKLPTPILLDSYSDGRNQTSYLLKVPGFYDLLPENFYMGYADGNQNTVEYADVINESKPDEYEITQYPKGEEIPLPPPFGGGSLILFLRKEGYEDSDSIILEQYS